MTGIFEGMFLKLFDDIKNRMNKGYKFEKKRGNQMLDCLFFINYFSLTIMSPFETVSPWLKYISSTSPSNSEIISSYV